MLCYRCREECSDGRQRTSWLIGLTKNAPVNGVGNRRIDIRSTIQDFKGKCETWAGHGADMTLEIKHLVFNSLPEYLAVHGRVAAQQAVDQERSPPTAAPAVEQQPLSEQWNGEQADAPGTAAELISDTKMESEPTDKQSKASLQAVNSANPESSVKEEGNVDESMQGDEEGCTDAVSDADDASEPKSSAGGSETDSPVGSKRKRDEAEANSRDGVQRITSMPVSGGGVPVIMQNLKQPQ